LKNSSLGEQLSVANLVPLCRIALGSRFGERVCRIAALGQQLWRTALGSSAGEQLWGAALGSSFEQLPDQRETGAALRSRFARQLRTSSNSSFQKPQL